MDKTFITALTGEGKPYNRACSARKMHPFCRLQRRLSTGKRLTRFSVAYGSLRIVFACHPGGGDLLSAYPCANLSCSLYSGEKTSPSGGSPRRGIGVHFHERSEVLWFSLPKAALPPKAAYILIARRAIPQPSEPFEPSEPSEPCHAVAPWAIPHPYL